VCHQTVGLTARALEKAGLPTIIIGSARDILDEVGVPRFAFTDLPLGNPVGPPGDEEQQRTTLRTALEFAALARHPRSSVVIPVEWTGSPDWRSTYMSVDDPAALRAAGDGRRAEQAAKKIARDAASQSTS
jgi:D-proline reductase (dithiol) PrdB